MSFCIKWKRILSYWLCSESVSFKKFYDVFICFIYIDGKEYVTCSQLYPDIKKYIPFIHSKKWVETRTLVKRLTPGTFSSGSLTLLERLQSSVSLLRGLWLRRLWVSVLRLFSTTPSIQSIFKFFPKVYSSTNYRRHKQVSHSERRSNSSLIHNDPIFYVVLRTPLYNDFLQP